jgi:hypothetical protein
MPHGLSEFKRLWEHLCANTLDNLVNEHGTIFDKDSLEEYLTPENNVTWQRDQTTIKVKVTFGANDSRVIDANRLLDSWELIIGAIAQWCLNIITKPRFRPRSLLPLNGQFQLLPLPSQVLITPRDEWFLTFPRGCFPALRDWRGRVSISGPPTNSLPKDAEPAAAWGNGFIQAKRNSFPVAAEFSLKGVDTPLDKLTVKKLTYIISARGRRPPSCIKNGPKPLHLSPGARRASPLGWKAIASLFTTNFLSSKDFHLPYRHIIHRGTVTRHTFPADHGPLCRFCRGANERTFHMGRCPVILEIFGNLRRL